MNSVISKITALLLCSSLAYGANITLPENELPSETVIPKTDTKLVVLNRTVQKAKRASIGVSAGALLDEIFYNSQVLTIDARYNFDESGAWGFRWDQWMGNATSYTETFASHSARLNFSAAPPRKSGAFVLRSWDSYYGKVSMGKDVITPMSFSWLVLAGAQNWETTWLPAVQAGAQLKLYFTKKNSIDLGYLFSFYQKLDPSSVRVRDNATPGADSFEKKLNFGQTVQLGITQVF